MLSFEYLPVNINNLNLVNVNRLTRLDCINFTTLDRKFNEGTGINIYLNDVQILYNGEQIAFNSNTDFNTRTYARVTTNMVFNSYKIKANTSLRNIENTNYLYHVEKTLDIFDDN